jgi:hypothetical protein
MWTSTTGNTICWFFADYSGDTPMTWTWTFDMFSPSPPVVTNGMPTVIILPGVIGTYDCQVVAESAFGSSTYDFQVEVTDVQQEPQ